MSTTDPKVGATSDPHPGRHGSENLGPDGQPVPALDTEAQKRPIEPPLDNDPPARPGDVPAAGSLSAESGTGPHTAERPMPARADRQRDSED